MSLGVPCVRVHYKKTPSVQAEIATFCILADRTSWITSLNELVLGYRILKDLFDSRPLKQAFDNILLTECVDIVSKKHSVSVI